MKTILKKISSRKFLMCVAGVVTGIALVTGSDADSICTIAGAITTLGSVVTYISVEGKIDADSVNSISDAIEQIKETIYK